MGGPGSGEKLFFKRGESLYLNLVERKSLSMISGRCELMSSVTAEKKDA